MLISFLILNYLIRFVWNSDKYEEEIIFFSIIKHKKNYILSIDFYRKLKIAIL